MSFESMNADLVRLEQDMRELSKDADRLLDDVAGQGRTLKDEALAAEFLANEETIENVGSILDALAKLGDIQRQQLRDLFADHRATIEALTQMRTPFDLLNIGFEHWARRASHAAEGIGQTVDVLANEARALANTLVEMWGPFMELLRQDWRKGDRAPSAAPSAEQTVTAA